MRQPPQLVQLAPLVPLTRMRSRLVQEDLGQHEATLRMYGPGPGYYSEFYVHYAGTPFESVALRRSLSVEEFKRCLRP